MNKYIPCNCCKPPKPYCGCDGDRKNMPKAVVSNTLSFAYMGTKNFSNSITCGDGQYFTKPQFQGVCFDGMYTYVAVCDGNDEYGCVIKYDADMNLVNIGPRISDFGHGKIAYDFDNDCLYVAQRKLLSDWDASGIHKIDKNTLASVDYCAVFNHQIIGFVQNDKELYYIGSDSSKMYTIANIDFVNGTFTRELVCDLPLASDFYGSPVSDSVNIQCWAFDGRNVVCIRNNPQAAIFYDMVDKTYHLSKIGDIMDYRTVGELEGCYTWQGHTIFISGCEVAEPIKTAGGIAIADIWVQWWEYRITEGSFGSMSTRENTHPGYEASPRNVIVDYDATNFYCNGTPDYPFRSLNEACDYFKHLGTAKGVYIISDFTGFARLFNFYGEIQGENGKQCDIRFSDNQNCHLVLKNLSIHDAEFFECDVYMFNVKRGYEEYDVYFNNGTAVSKLYNGVVMNNVFYQSRIYFDEHTDHVNYDFMADSLGALGDIWVYSKYWYLDENHNH